MRSRLLAFPGNCLVLEKLSRPRKTLHIWLVILIPLYRLIAVYRLDIYARSTIELLLEIQKLVKKGIEFHSLSEQLDFGSASGRLHLAILSAFAEFERSLLRERVILGQQRAKQQGIKIGRPVRSTDKRKRKNSGYLERGKKKRFMKEYQKILPPNNYDFLNH